MKAESKGIDCAIENSELYLYSKELIVQARQTVYFTANYIMVETYWRIGRKIVEEQSGEAYAKYGEGLLKRLSQRLSDEFGRGFTYVNLTNMRKFYQLFQNVYALRKELSAEIKQIRSMMKLEI